MTTATDVWQERIFGRDLIKTRRLRADLDHILPNEKQPRQGKKEDVELRKQILENGGVFEPLLVEPHPDDPTKYRIIDGERRWTNSKAIVADKKAAGEEQHEIDKFRLVPIEATDRLLTDEERYRVWVYIHRQRREWSRKEKEGTAFALARYMDRARAANVLGVSIAELDKLIRTFELSERIKNLPDPDASITWAREINNLSARYRPPEVEDILIRKINQGKLKNSKEVRELRKIVPYPPALDEFMSENGTIESALKKLPDDSGGGSSHGSYGGGILRDIQAFSEQLGRYAWTELEALRDDAYFREALDAADERLALLRRALGQTGGRRKG